MQCPLFCWLLVLLKSSSIDTLTLAICSRNLSVQEYFEIQMKRDLWMEEVNLSFAPPQFIDRVSFIEAVVRPLWMKQLDRKGEHSQALMRSANDNFTSIKSCRARRLWCLGLEVGASMDMDFKKTRSQQHKGHSALIVSLVPCADFCVLFYFIIIFLF